MKGDRFRLIALIRLILASPGSLICAKAFSPQARLLAEQKHGILQAAQTAPFLISDPHRFANH